MKVKSNMMGTLSLLNGPPPTAVFNGKATVGGVGNYTFTTKVEDVGQPGVNTDRFGIQVKDPVGVVMADIDYLAAPYVITGGNIQVPQPQGKK